VQHVEGILSSLEQRLLDGQAALEAGRYLEAARAFDSVLELLHNDWTIWQMAAQAWKLAGDTVRERAAWIGAFSHWRDGQIRDLFVVGGGLLQSGAPFEASRCLERVAASLPNDSSALGALAAAYRSSGQLADAWRVIHRALKISPRSATLCLTAAQIRHAQGDLEEAHRWLDKADRLRPDHGPTRLQRGLTTLLAGPSAAGWTGFEDRGLPVCRTPARPWRGEPLDGQSILVLGEQGVGDLFHFLRFIPALSERGASTIVIEAPRSTHALLEHNRLAVVTPGDAPETMWYVPLLSLPHVLGTDRSHATQQFPYLHSDTAPTLRRQSPRHRPRIGVTWKGNPGFLATALRDLDPALLRELPELFDAEWVSLQLGEPVPDGFHHQPFESPDWMSTARVLESLDAVISVDTAIAHLAGAMGLSPIVLLPYSPDWRWGLASSATPWYPETQLIRQASPNDWRSVLTPLQGALRKRWPSEGPRT
jgi:tetratricopeptide (TPR) repeat protein